MENLGLFIASQIFAFIALVFVVIAYQQKQKTKIMILLAIANIFVSVSWLFLQSWITASIIALVVVRILLYNWLDNRYKKIHWSFLVLFLVLTGIISWLTYQSHYDIILIVSGLGFVYATWQKNVPVFKILAIICGTLMVTYSAINANYVGIAIDSFSIISIVLSYIIEKNKKQKSNSKL